MECTRLQACPFYQECLFYNDKTPIKQGFGPIFKKKYCKGNYHLCARYKVLCEADASFVPSSLYPSMLDIAERIIASAKKG